MDSQNNNKVDSKIKILLLTREDCDQSKKVLAYFNNDMFEVYNIVSKKMGEKLPPESFSFYPDYIFSFRSLFILPFKLLKTVQKYSINFHPGPPDYPGSGSVNLALYNDEDTFGVTAHLINENIDNGQIIKTKMFNIDSKDNVNSLLNKTHQYLYLIFEEVAENLFLKSGNYIEQILKSPSKDSWRGEANKISLINNLQSIDCDISEKELKRRLRAIHTEEYPLYIVINGKKFTITNN